MAVETTNFLEWAAGQGVSFWEVMARNFTHQGPFGPNEISKSAQLTRSQNRLDLLLTPTQFGLLSGLVLFLFLRHKITRWREEYSHLKLTSKADLRRTAYTFLTFLEFIVLSPLLLTIFVTFQLYRTVISIILQRRYGKHFKGLLDGADVVWAIEDQNSRGMINIMANAEEPFTSWTSVDGSMSADILLTLRKRISSRLMRNYQPHPKMFWKRNVELGYYFWSDQSELTVEDYIRYMDTIPLADNQHSIDERRLRTLLSNINNRQLPAEHTSSWEVLVGRQPVYDATRNVLKYPILFRIHHSLGDGVALMRLLLEAIVDKEVPSRWKHLSKLKVMNIDYILEQKTADDHHLILTGTRLQRVWKRIPSSKDLAAQWDRLKRILWTIYTAPAFFNDISRRQTDNNCIHASQMTNEKVLSWINEDYTSETRWVEIIKRTKRLLPGTRFSDIFLTALSSSLEAYFTRQTGNPPKTLTVVLPARIEKESTHLKLHNRFSVALQTLPITPGIQIDDANRHYALMNRILAVKRYSDSLRSSSDYMINFWIMSKMTCLFPEVILRKFLKSVHSTLAISNLPGPQQRPRIHGRELTNLSFFIPNLGTTAVGITLLTYGGKLQLGVLADRAVIQSEDEAHTILQGTIEEIERMGQLLDEA
uniref:O-acyltransferase WSD1 C-terminal domain-containing protein n=1 Tax=Anopheles dirus TaxID=7168 RepID=A0A182MYW2_9DIPT